MKFINMKAAIDSNKINPISIMIWLKFFSIICFLNILILP